MRRSLKYIFFKPLGMACLLVALSACDPLTLGTTIGGIAGITALEERPLDVNYADRQIQISIHTALQQQKLKKKSNVFVMTYDGDVMLVGYVETSEVKKSVLEVTSNISGVQRVYDELREFKVDSPTFTKDRWIGLKIGTRLSLEKGIHAVNYVVRVYDGVVFMMGLAVTQQEAEQIQTVISSIEGVRGLISRVKIKQPDTIIPQSDEDTPEDQLDVQTQSLPDVNS